MQIRRRRHPKISLLKQVSLSVSAWPERGGGVVKRYFRVLFLNRQLEINIPKGQPRGGNTVVPSRHVDHKRQFSRQKKSQAPEPRSASISQRGKCDNQTKGSRTFLRNVPSPAAACPIKGLATTCLKIPPTCQEVPTQNS